MYNVLIVFPETILGDTLAYFPSCSIYQEKHKCNLYACLRKDIRFVLEKQYPNIHFIDKSEIDNYKFDKIINFQQLGLIVGQDVIKANKGLIGFAEHHLDVKSNGEIPKFDLSATRKIKDPYVCISTQASGYIKTWSYPNGWDYIINYLKKILGYKIVLLDSHTTIDYDFKYFDEQKKRIDSNVKKLSLEKLKIEYYTYGNFSLQDRIDLIKDADFFIGTSSGLSWLAWGCKVPVVMISGFTKPENEFYTPYRVYPNKGCRDCNSFYTGKGIDKIDLIGCVRCKKVIQIKDEIIPECSMNITPQMVIDKINQIPSVQKRIIEYWKKNG